MRDVVEQRRALVDFLDRHPLVDSVDFTRDGYQQVLLELGEPASDEGGQPAFTVTVDGRRLAFFESGSGQWYRQEFEATPDRACGDWRPVGVEQISEPDLEVYDAE